jgi:SWI/SNF-related matrix-associated actin-dependent regulator of chromatin subfamily A-like protein 1
LKIVQTHKDFEVSFSGGQFFRQMLSMVKDIPGSWYEAKFKLWHVPRHREEEVKKLRVLFCPEEGNNATILMDEITGEIPQLPTLTFEIPLARPLLHFQGPAVQYGYEKKRFINGDQMGCCKTATAIATVIAADAFPCLVICPATLKLNWQREWKTTADRKAMVLTDSTKKSWSMYSKVGMIDVFITNYESLEKYFVLEIKKELDKNGNELPLKLKHIVFHDNIKIFKSVIVDEAHKLRNETRASKMTMGIMKEKDYAMLLTGTPIVNSPRDLMQPLYAIDRLKEVVSHIPQPRDRHGYLIDGSGKKRFEDRYCGDKKGTNLKELNFRLNSICYFRREKSEVMADLPPKVRQVITCEITNRKEYNHAERQFIDYLKSVKKCNDQQVRKKLAGEVMVKMGILKDISARGKIEAVKEHISEITDGGQKAVIFCHLKEVRKALADVFTGCVQIHGEQNDQQKQRSVDMFQGDSDVSIILCSLKAGSVGITLTASSNVSFIELPWTFADCEQAEDRCHRKGQKDSVQASYFLGSNTIDEYIYDHIIIPKKTMMQDISGALDNVHEELIDNLLNIFNQR